MSSERLIARGVPQSEAPMMSRSHSSRQCGEQVRIFEELPTATIESVSRPDTGDISPMLLSYTIELQYKQACTNSLSLASLYLLVLFAEFLSSLMRKGGKIEKTGFWVLCCFLVLGFWHEEKFESVMQNSCPRRILSVRFFFFFPFSFYLSTFGILYRNQMEINWIGIMGCV